MNLICCFDLLKNLSNLQQLQTSRINNKLLLEYIIILFSKLLNSIVGVSRILILFIQTSQINLQSRLNSYAFNFLWYHFYQKGYKILGIQNQNIWNGIISNIMKYHCKILLFTKFCFIPRILPAWGVGIAWGLREAFFDPLNTHRLWSYQVQDV